MASLRLNGFERLANFSQKLLLLLPFLPA